MKFRTDFVTNSSSSGFVAVTVKLKNGESIKYEKEYDSGYGRYFGDGVKFGFAFDKAETGADIYAAILDNTYGNEIIESKNPEKKQVEFKQKLHQIGSVDEIESIIMQESNYFDRDAEEVYEDFKIVRNEIVFVTHETATPSYNNHCMVFGDFTIGNDDGKYSTVSNMIEQKGWIFSGAFKESYVRERLSNKSFPHLKYLIVGDITAQELEKGIDVSLENTALRLQKEYGYDLIRESEFFALEKYEMPLNTFTIDSLKNRKVCLVGKFEREGVREYLFDHGAFIMPDDDIPVCDYVIVGNSSMQKELPEKIGWLCDKRQKKKRPIISEEDLYRQTSPITAEERQSELQSISCRGKRFFLAGGANRKRNLVTLISEQGGIIEKGSLTKKIDYVVFQKYDEDVYAAELLRLDRNKIRSIRVDDFYKVAEVIDSKTKSEDTNDFEIDKRGKLVDYSGIAKEVVIPDGVKIIGKGAFKNHSNITAVVIPGGVTRIESEAFCSCKKLSSISLPDSLRKIGKSAFKETGLTDVIIPEGVEEIEDSAFRDCKKIKNLSLPSTLRKIGKWAFKYAAITELTIPEGIDEIADHAFRSCKNLESVFLPGTIRRIGGFAFDNTRLVKVIIPEGVEIIEEAAFRSFSGVATDQKIRRDFFVPVSVVKIEDDYTFIPNGGVYGVLRSESIIVIHTSKGSAADQYAQKKKLQVEYDYGD